MLKPHDFRHGVAMEVRVQQHDLEQVRALLGHARIDTTQIYTMIRPSQLKQVVSFYEEPVRRILTSRSRGAISCLRTKSMVLKHDANRGL